MEATQETILDTSVLFSKEFQSLLGRRLLINDSVILEYLQVMVALRDEALQGSEPDKARGREDQLRYFAQLVRENGIELRGSFTIEQLEMVTQLILDRGIDPGDAVICVWSGARKIQVATKDNDFDRLTDICSVLKVPVSP